MSEKTVNPPGRPRTLSADDEETVFLELSALEPKTEPYRRKRRELAVRYELGERGIEIVCERVAARKGAA